MNLKNDFPKLSLPLWLKLHNMTFKALDLIDPILRSLEEKGYTHPTTIQEEAIPILLKGRDLLGCAQTGTGKTAAFAIPIIQKLSQDYPRNNAKRIRALVVTPTRELAIQIADNFTAYGKYTNLRNTVIFGGVKQGAQTNQLRKGVDILIATPGRLLDLMNQGFISLSDVEYFVLDEADQMLDMGFINDIKKLLAKLPRKRQSLFFSATMPPAIEKLSSSILTHHDTITIQPEKTTAERVEQALYYVTKNNKGKLLIHLIHEHNLDATLVFSRTKHGANKIVKVLENAGITAAAIHGNKSQTARQKALSSFKDGETQVLVATDIAARGIDISQLPLVINHDLPNVPETYVHRIGRTGRAKASGIAISFCNMEEREYLRDIQKLISQKIPVVSEHPFNEGLEAEVVTSKPKQQGKKNSQGKANPSNRRRSKGVDDNNTRRSRGFNGKQNRGKTTNSNSRGRK